MPGPKNKGCINFDSYQTDSPPPAVKTDPAKVINPSDSKFGPPSPTSGKKGATINPDTYHE